MESVTSRRRKYRGLRTVDGKPASSHAALSAGGRLKRDEDVVSTRDVTSLIKNFDGLQLTSIFHHIVVMPNHFHGNTTEQGRRRHYKILYTKTTSYLTF